MGEVDNGPGWLREHDRVRLDVGVPQLRRVVGRVGFHLQYESRAGRLGQGGAAEVAGEVEHNCRFLQAVTGSPR